MSRLVPRLATVGGAAVLAVGLAAAPALAHVSVDSPGATQGGFAVVTFRVPTESETASTTGLKVQFPADQPLAFVSVKPRSGWSYTVRTSKLATPIASDDGEVTEAVSVIDWKATAGGGIEPGQFDEFQVSAGPLPKVAAMTFKVIQTYSDGKQVAWIEESAGETEPRYPAPTLKLAAAAPAATAPTAPSVGATPAATTDAASKGSVTGAYVLGGLGLLAGLAGLALGLTARRRPVTVVGPQQEQPTVRAGAE
jgi:uncharacterized protein YcnI